MITKRVVAACPVPDGLTVAVTCVERFLGTLLVCKLIIALFDPTGTVKFTKVVPIGKLSNEMFEKVNLPGVATRTFLFTVTWTWMFVLCRTVFFGRILTETTSVALIVRVADTGGSVPAFVVNVTVLVSVTIGVVIAKVATALPVVNVG